MVVLFAWSACPICPFKAATSPATGDEKQQHELQSISWELERKCARTVGAKKRQCQNLVVGTTFVGALGVLTLATGLT
jgi:hypothetical protein